MVNNLSGFEMNIFCINPLSNDKISEWLKLKTFTDDKINVTEELKTSYQHFLLFPECFQKASFSRSFKVGILW